MANRALQNEKLTCLFYRNLECRCSCPCVIQYSIIYNTSFFIILNGCISATVIWPVKLKRLANSTSTAYLGQEPRLPHLPKTNRSCCYSLYIAVQCSISCQCDQLLGHVRQPDQLLSRRLDSKEVFFLLLVANIPAKSYNQQVLHHKSRLHLRFLLMRPYISLHLVPLPFPDGSVSALQGQTPLGGETILNLRARFSDI